MYVLNSPSLEPDVSSAVLFFLLVPLFSCSSSPSISLSLSFSGDLTILGGEKGREDVGGHFEVSVAETQSDRGDLIVREGEMRGAEILLF